jgi:hypothetical protein
MVPSRWFSREGPFVGAHYALEIASVQLRRRATTTNNQQWPMGMGAGGGHVVAVGRKTP